MGGMIPPATLEQVRAASDIVEIEMAFDTKLVAPELGYFFTTAIA